MGVDPKHQNGVLFLPFVKMQTKSVAESSNIRTPTHFGGSRCVPPPPTLHSPENSNVWEGIKVETRYQPSTPAPCAAQQSLSLLRDGFLTLERQLQQEAANRRHTADHLNRSLKETVSRLETGLSVEVDERMQSLKKLNEVG